MKDIEVAGKKIGKGNPTFIIAEAGVNHNGNPELARELVDAAARAGADAVKFQTFKAKRLVVSGAPKADYQRQGTDSSESQFEMLQQLELSEDAHRELVTYCHDREIIFLSTPFDEESANFLESLGVAAFKIPSGELTNHPFLAFVAAKHKPIIASTGMAYLGEVEEAVRVIEDTGNHDYVLLHCVSSYPASPSDVNLRAMETMSVAFDVPVGFSDHTLGIEVAIAAVSLGACAIEKHFTLDRSLPGPDQRVSLEPNELTSLVRGIRNVEMALGSGTKEPVASEGETAAVARKSLVAGEDIPAGAVLSAKMIVAMRPGTGLPPAMQEHILGRRTKHLIPAGTLFALEMLS